MRDNAIIYENGDKVKGGFTTLKKAKILIGK
jgi:hypothetical protein